MINMLRATRRPVTLRRAVLGALTICLAGLTGFLIMTLLIAPRLTQDMVNVDPAPSGATESSSVLSPAAALVERYDCWTDQAPDDMEGQLPGHAVVTRPGSTGPEYAGPIWVGRALEHVFNNKHPRLRVHAFCR